MEWSPQLSLLRQPQRRVCNSENHHWFNPWQKQCGHCRVDEGMCRPRRGDSIHYKSFGDGAQTCEGDAEVLKEKRNVPCCWLTWVAREQAPSLHAPEVSFGPRRDPKSTKPSGSLWKKSGSERPGSSDEEHFTRQHNKAYKRIHLNMMWQYFFYGRIWWPYLFSVQGAPPHGPQVCNSHTFKQKYPSDTKRWAIPSCLLTWIIIPI